METLDEKKPTRIEAIDENVREWHLLDENPT
jgi:hypothetical protein